MHVEQIYDKGLAHASYAIESEGQVALVDPGRDPQPYLDFAKRHRGRIVAVLETHPHADFTSSHREFKELHGATIYHNDKMGVSYDYEPLNDGDTLQLGKVTFRALFTPGHSPDHNSYLLLDENGEEVAVFSGDSLFIGDVGRPDLREKAGNLQGKRVELAGQMYETLQTVFKLMPDDVTVYPAHGAGSACGKNMSSETVSTIGAQRRENWAMQADDREAFIDSLLEDQPDIPKYFPYDVEVNRHGMAPYATSLSRIPRHTDRPELDPAALIVDARPAEAFKEGHLPGAFNIPEGGKFETWLGTLIDPETPFYVVAADEVALGTALRKAAKIGYEAFIRGGLTLPAGHVALTAQEAFADPDALRQQPGNYTIVDVRRAPEHKENAPFSGSLNIPLNELAARAAEVPTDKPVVVHCAAGYRSAIGSSILARQLGDQTQVLDLSDAIKDFL